MPGLSDIDAGRILERLDHFERRFDDIDDRFNKIDDRLDRGDKRFIAHDQDRAVAQVVHRFAYRIGSAVLLGAGGAGMWILTQLWPAIQAFFWPPKH